jgi:TolA-binding protein
MVSALLLWGGPLLASTREDRAYDAAVREFQDKLYSEAEAKLTQYLQSYRKSTNAPAAVLLLAQAEFYQKNYAAASSRLADPANLARAKAVNLEDQYDYWRAEAQFAAGDTVGAAATFVQVAENHPDSPLAVKAVVEAAAAFGRDSEWAKVDDLLESTNGLFQRRALLDSTNEQIITGRLLQAESKCAQQDFARAIAVLGTIKAAPLAPEQDWQRALLLYRADFGLRNLDGALADAANLVQIARPGQGAVWLTNQSESVACRAEVFEAQGHLAQAAEVWQQNLATNVPAGQQRRAILKVADLAVAQGNLEAAEVRLLAFLTDYPDSPAAGAAQLRLGELQLQQFIAQPAATNQLGQARINLGEVIRADPKGPLAGKAHLDHGWCNWLMATNAFGLGNTSDARQRWSESYDDFKAAAALLPRGSSELAEATFKMGDAQFELTDYAAAIGNYRVLLADFSGQTNVINSLGDRALFQILRAQLELRDTNGLDATMSELMGKYFGSDITAQGLLLAGRGFLDFGDSGKARDLFERFRRERPNSPLLPRIEFALAQTYEHEQRWRETVTNCEDWLQKYPVSEIRPQVEYVRDRAVARLGDEAKAFVLFTNFVTRYSTNAELTPLARWWVADHYFRLGTNFLDAEKQYQLIFTDFPDDHLAGQARLMAARAALARSSYKQAVDYYLWKLIDDTNAPTELRDKARFAYCEAERGMASETNVQSLLVATNVLAQMYYETPTNLVGALAWCETGACDLQAGALDAATNAFAQVLAAPSATVELRSRAQAGLGDVWQKKAESFPIAAQRPLLAQALAHYTEVIYTSGEGSDPFWMKYAALKALPLIPLVEGDANRFIDRLEHWLPQLTDLLEKKRAALDKK